MKDVKRFAERWRGKGDEKSETQTFWNELLHDILGVERPGEVIEYEKRVELEHKSFIDAYIPSTRVLIEQKSLDVNLDRAAKQSDGASATPFDQAKRYRDWLPASQQGRWIVVCNFAEFRIHDMERPKAEPEVIKLEDLPREWRKLQFLADTKGTTPRDIHELDVSVQAGALVGKLYDALLKRYVNPSDSNSLRSLNILCVRIVFLLYAEDAGLFDKGAFHDYLAARKGMARNALLELFKVLSQKDEERDPYLDADLKAFRYVNGGLFEEAGIEVPQFDGEPFDIILHDMSEGFDWSGISPTIFGAVFESTLNEKTRRAGGMHYTSIENIHRVIDPLFLDGLKTELDEMMSAAAGSGRTLRLRNFQKRLASLTFLDPACGSGNFLTETYLSLRRMENRIISELAHGQISFAEGEFTPIQVSIGQFYGIEINDFAVSVARTALWIAEAQMMKETRSIVDIRDDVLPLKNYNHIVEGNALTLDWREVVERPDYIMGNPPFVGARMMAQGSEQKKEVQSIFGDIKDVQDLDYVCCWYKKAATLIQDTPTRVGFVSTNSICQGSQVPILWNVLLNKLNVKIHFAYQAFRWDSEATDKAHVYCVIIGFSVTEPEKRLLFLSNGKVTQAENISPYLFDGSSAFVVSQKTSLCDVPQMNFGNQPRDGGHFVLSEEEKQRLLQAEPLLKKWIHPYIGAEEFIKQKPRYCLWLRDAQPNDIKQSRTLYERVQAVREFRLASSAKTTRGYARVPHLFAQITQPEGVDYLLVPGVSSSNRKYIPIGFMSKEVIASNLVYIIPHVSLYHFGVLTSIVHMAWMRVVCGRLGMGYRYSKEQVYNTFPWPTPTDEQREKIERTAQGILDARTQYPDSSLADLYDELTMPPELRKAHRTNDAAVLSAYGFERDMSEPEITARLMGRYEQLVKVRVVI